MTIHWKTKRTLLAEAPTESKELRLIPGLRYKVKGQEMTFHRWSGIDPEFYFEADRHTIYFVDRKWKASDIVLVDGPIIKI